MQKSPPNNQKFLFKFFKLQIKSEVRVYQEQEVKCVTSFPVFKLQQSLHEEKQNVLFQLLFEKTNSAQQEN